MRKVGCCREAKQVIAELAGKGLTEESLIVHWLTTTTADKWKSLPKGWTEKSLKKFWGSLTGDRKHKITQCIKKMTGKVDDPGAFCGGLASKVGYR